MPLNIQLKNQHLLWRAAFGPNVKSAFKINSVDIQSLYATLENNSLQEPVAINVVGNFINDIYQQMQGNNRFENLTREQKQAIRKESREGIKKLNLAWLKEMINSEAQLREKMAFFWHGHFACRVVNIYFQQQLLQVIRKNALSDFGTLLKEVSKSAAMLSFLNNQQNKKQHPNENFAREVMELFTLGRGNYTENDIKEAARAFTGWGFNIQGEFVERPFQHDNGTKTFLGKTGNFNGDDILNILLEQKQTADFITKKIYRFFVNEAVDDAHVKSLATSFFQSRYDLKQLLKNIYTSPQFYDEKNIGSKIKSPVELLVGIRRILPMTIEKEEAQLLMQRVLGQVLFNPPNVAGWPGGKNWIDSSSLMVRLRLPQLIAGADEFAIKPKDDDDTAMGIQNENANRKQQFGAVINWNDVLSVFAQTPKENLSESIEILLLQTKSKPAKNLLGNYINKSSREDFIKTTVTHIMSTPEYQMC